MLGLRGFPNSQEGAYARPHEQAISCLHILHGCAGQPGLQEARWRATYPLFVRVAKLAKSFLVGNLTARTGERCRYRRPQ
jgi:hypothetical protein